MFNVVRASFRKAVTGTKWKLVKRAGWRYAWNGGSETVIVYWMDGAGPHSGWTVNIEQRGTDVTQVMGNGFVDFRDALLLADRYMTDGTITPAFLGGMRQDEWLERTAPDYEFQCINPTTLHPDRPQKATGN